MTSFTTDRSRRTYNPGTNIESSTTTKGATQDGYVVSADVQLIGGTIPTRGQMYSILSTGGLGGSFEGTQLFAGYLYLGSPVALGRFVESGPAGGHGAQANNTLSGPAAGADYASYVAPTGSIQRVKGFFGQFTTGAGAANREFSIEYLSSTIRGGVVAGEIQTANLTVDYIGADGGVSSSGVTSNLAGGVTEIGLANIILVAGINALQFKTYNIQALDQWGVGNLITEEWVVPN